MIDAPIAAIANAPINNLAGSLGVILSNAAIPIPKPTSVTPAFAIDSQLTSPNSCIAFAKMNTAPAIANICAAEPSDLYILPNPVILVCLPEANVCAAFGLAAPPAVEAAAPCLPNPPILPNPPMETVLLKPTPIQTPLNIHLAAFIPNNTAKVPLGPSTFKALLSTGTISFFNTLPNSFIIGFNTSSISFKAGSKAANIVCLSPSNICNVDCACSALSSLSFCEILSLSAKADCSAVVSFEMS